LVVFPKRVLPCRQRFHWSVVITCANAVPFITTAKAHSPPPPGGGWRNYPIHPGSALRVAQTALSRHGVPARAAGQLQSPLGC
jgi:hypothetical protein